MTNAVVNDDSTATGPFSAALREATALAALAPSSHNCQPWALAHLTGKPARSAAAGHLGGGGTDHGAEHSTDHSTDHGSEYLALALDRDRAIGALDAHAVEMNVSCGAYWQLLLRALEAQGWRIERLRFSEGQEEGPRTLGADWPGHWTLLSVVELRRRDAGPGDPHPADSLASLDALRSTARGRRTNRAPYRTDEVDPALLDGLTLPSAAAAADTAVTVTHLREQGDRVRFGDFVARHGGRDFSHGTAWRETHSFIRWSAAEAERRGDGFTLAQLFGELSRPRHLMMRIALSPATMSALRWVGYHRFLARQLAAIVRRTPVIVAMNFDSATPGTGDMVRGGARLADYWLRATRAGLVLHPVSVVIQHDDLRRDLEQRFGLRGRTYFVSRLGHPQAELPAAPRRGAAAEHRAI